MKVEMDLNTLHTWSGIMRFIKKFILSTFVGLFFVVSPAAIAIDPSSINGGNTATDYQPTTQNPQSNVGNGLQQNAGGLQPTSGNNALSQASLPTVSNLQVVGTKGQSNPNITKIDPITEVKPKSRVWLIVLGTLAFGLIIFTVWYNSYRTTKAVIPEIIEPLEKPKRTKPKKKSSKKKKAKK